MAAKRYLVHVGIDYPTNPTAAREDWEWARAEPGEVVSDIPASSLGWLEDAGAITPAGESDAPLPDDFPTREALIEAGYTTIGKVEAHIDQVREIPGIGPKTQADIQEALLLWAETAPVNEGEG